MEPIDRTKQFDCLLEAQWSKVFPKDNLLRSRLIEIDRKFYDYLLEDGTFIHPKYTRDYDPKTDEYLGVEEQQPDSKVNKQPEEEDIDVRQIQQFPVVAAAIAEALDQFEGRAFVKIGWKSPKDCKSWLPEMKCTHIEDVFMALKCSEYMSELLVDYQPFWWPKESPHHRMYLVLKEFIDVNKGMEFRCFVRNSQLVGICQRNPETVYPDLLQLQSSIKSLLLEFIASQLLPRMKSMQHLPDYVADLYITAEHRPLVLDINPWRQFTNPLMFSWQELQASHPTPEFRLVRTQQDIVCQDLRDYNIPSEFAQGDKSQLLQMMQLMKTNPELFY